MLLNQTDPHDHQPLDTDISPMKTYKVLTRNDHWLFGKFDPTELEMNLNNLARQGWRVVSTCTNDVWAWLGNRRQEIVVILEKDI